MKLTRRQKRSQLNIQREDSSARSKRKPKEIVQDEQLYTKRYLEPIKPLNEPQARYLHSIERNIITFSTGPAGTGKSYIAGGWAADQIADGKIDKIIITRPCVEAGESLGFLPGELEDKFAPYIDPFRSILNERLGKSFVTYLLKTKKIDAKPLAYMRGETFKDCVVILDEAQNATVTQMLLFLTRIGNNCKVIINGDITQKDIRQQSGLLDAIRKLCNVPRVGHIHFEVDDIVRSKIVRDIIIAYSEG